MKNNRIELLAPAGNMNCLKTAVLSGADAVYFAGKNYGARSFADNFSDDEIEKAVDFCHIYGVKAYLTVNTLISDREMFKTMEYIKKLYEMGVDALIVQDIGLCKLIRENFPDFSIHGSTQMTVHNTKGVSELEKIGVSQVVLSRELSLSDIKKIKENTSARLEVFGHGAMCMSYSGQCLMSSVLGGRSGNRGKCAQPCRLKYNVNNNHQKGCYMSLKDLCTLKHIKKFKEIGIASLKIEGRMKGEEYVSTVVRIYRKYLDSEKNPSRKDIEDLNRIFFRGGLTDGYLTGKIGKDMFCFNKPDNPYENQNKTNFLEFNRKRHLDIFVNFSEGEVPYAEVYDGKICVRSDGEKKLDKAEKNIVSREKIKTLLTKTGGTPYEFDNISVKLLKRPHISASCVNDLRRTVLRKYENTIIESHKKHGKLEISSLKSKEKESLKYFCRVSNLEQFRKASDYDFKYFYVPATVIHENIDEFLNFKDKIIIETSAVVKDTSHEYVILKTLKEYGFKKLCADNIAFCDFSDFELFGGLRLNVFNGYTLEMLKRKTFKNAVLSSELNINAIRDMKKPISTTMMIYGYLPLMITENCIVKNGDACPCSGKSNYIVDRKNIKFPVIRDGKSCRNIILNSLPIYLGDKISEIKKSGVEGALIYFSIEDSKMVGKVCKACFNEETFFEDYTRLHYNKGVL